MNHHEGHHDPKHHECHYVKTIMRCSSPSSDCRARHDSHRHDRGERETVTYGSDGRFGKAGYRDTAKHDEQGIQQRGGTGMAESSCDGGQGSRRGREGWNGQSRRSVARGPSRSEWRWAPGRDEKWGTRVDGDVGGKVSSLCFRCRLRCFVRMLVSIERLARSRLALTLLLPLTLSFSAAQPFP